MATEPPEPPSADGSTSAHRPAHPCLPLFDDREVDALLGSLTDDVEWPDYAAGTILHGKPAIRSYWLGQFSVASPQVEPAGFIPAGDDLVAVVRHEVFDLSGDAVTQPGIVGHRYSFAGALVRRMVVFSDRDRHWRSADPPGRDL